MVSSFYNDQYFEGRRA